MSAFAESLKTEWEHQELGKAEVVRTQTGDIENEIGQLTSHPLINSNELTPYHVGVAMEFAVSTIKHTGKRRVSRGVIDWETIENNPVEQRRFQERIKQLVGNGPVAYSDYMAIIIRAGYDTATKNIEVSKGWFEENREVLQPLYKQSDESSPTHREEKNPGENK